MSETAYQFTVQHADERLDKLITAHLPTLSRSRVQSLIKDGLVRVDGEQVKAGVKLRGGEQVVVTLVQDDDTSGTVQPEDVPLDVVYEDATFAVIDKPAGMVVHPGVGNESGTLAGAILARYPEIGMMDDPDDRHGIVHRLDKDTSGLIVIARTPDALANLMAQFQERNVEKSYLALLERTPRSHTGRIEAPIARDPRKRKQMAVVRDGKEAVTDFTVQDTAFREQAALVEFRPKTGRTHQIRVHAAFLGCPIIGDNVYGFRKQRIKMKRIFLHASALAFDHPMTGERLHFERDLPVGLQQVMQKLRA